MPGEGEDGALEHAAPRKVKRIEPARRSPECTVTSAERAIRNSEFGIWNA
jgi:hypothetical protein